MWLQAAVVWPVPSQAVLAEAAEQVLILGEAIYSPEDAHGKNLPKTKTFAVLDAVPIAIYIQPCTTGFTACVFLLIE